MPRRRRRRLSAVSLNASFADDTSSNNNNKQSSGDLTDADVSFVDIGNNDDEKERQVNRGRHRRNTSMRTPVASAARRKGSHRSRRSSRRGSPSPFGTGARKEYTNDQLSEIYKECIVKAQTGKINQQNAWNLHLVDQIKEITHLNTDSNDKDATDKQRSSNNLKLEFNAFARASHTIDAASKIYGYRVDSVHNKMYKVLDGLHQQTGDGNGGQYANEEDAVAAKKRKQRNRNVGKSTLCEPEKAYKINETMKNLCVEVDALFHKTASCFDEGGAKGLLMNTLYVQNGCDIVFDSQTKIEQNEDITNEGLQVNNDDVENADEILKENRWTTQLFADTFKKKVDAGFDAFDQFTQPMDMTSDDFDVSTQTKPENFVVDMKWIETTSLCPLLNAFDNNINAISKHLPCDWSTVESSNGANNSNLQDATPEKDLNNANNASYDDVHNGGFGDDDDIMMDMPDFTIGDNEDMNAQNLFHEEMLTQAQAPFNANNAQASLLMMAAAAGNSSTHALMQQSLLQQSALDPSQLEYVVGQDGDIGNMGVQPLLNNSMGFAFGDNQRVLNNIELERQNNSMLHQQGIYKRGAMNLGAMNEVISKLENADFESLTTFFDTKKHGNWAGPDQWYHRRYQLMTKQTQKKRSASKSPSKSGSLVANERAKSPKQRKKKGSSKFDFMSIANGNFIDEKEFEEPQRSFNTLTKAVLDKNRKTYHTLPKDLQIKPDMFIKLFHRPNYSVWKHWLRQHQIRMMKKNEALMEQRRAEQGGDVDGNGDMDMMNADMSAMHMHDAMHGMADDDEAMPQFMAQQAAAMAVVGDANGVDDEDEFKYNYNNALDTSHFVPNMNDPQADPLPNAFDFNLNGYDMIEMDQSKKLNVIQVEYATKAKKVNVRKLKYKLWDKLATDLTLSNKENVESNSNRNVKAQEEDNSDIEMNENNNNSNEQQPITFQAALDSLPSNLSSSISVHMCFICLLHLANEKELQFVPKIKQEEASKSEMKMVLERGNFEIQYANKQSQFEKDAEKINPVMVLGMQ